MIADTHTTGEITTEAASETTTDDRHHDRHHDRHGNHILGARGPYGQYRIVSALDGRVLHVCGEAATTKHLPLWEYHTGERRYVCALCWPEPNA